MGLKRKSALFRRMGKDCLKIGHKQKPIHNNKRQLPHCLMKKHKDFDNDYIWILSNDIDRNASINSKIYSIDETDHYHIYNN